MTDKERKQRENNASLTEFSITPEDHLLVTLTEEGRKYLSEERDSLSERDDHAFIELIEEHLCNTAWEEILPEKIGVLTEAVLLTYDPLTDDEGELISCGRVYKWDYYQVRDYIESLMEDGTLLFQGHD